VLKFRQATPPNSEVISANLLHFKPIFNPPLKKSCKGAPVPGEGCASKNWSCSSACKNLGAQHPLGAEIWSSEKCDLGYVNINAYNVLRSGRNFTKFFLFNAELTVLVNAVQVMSISLSSLEIFAVKLESCRKTY